MDPAGALRGCARRGDAVSPRRVHRGPGSFRGAGGGSGASRAGALRQRRDREGRLPPFARPAARRRAGTHPGPRQTCAAHIRKDAGRHQCGGRLARPRHRGQRGDLLAVPPSVAAPAAGRRAGAAGQPRSSRTQTGSGRHHPGRRLRRDLQLPDVPRSPAGADRLHRRRGALQLRRPRGLRRPDVPWPGNAGLRVVLPGSGPCARRGKAARPRGRHADRRPAGRRSQPRLLADRAGRRTRRDRRGPARQRPAADHHRRGAVRLRRHDARRTASDLRADHPAGRALRGIRGPRRLRRPPELLGLSLRPPQARRIDRAGARGHRAAVPQHPDRGRNPAAGRHERPADGGVRRQANPDPGRPARTEPHG